jgi:hypothetical protein
MAMVRISTGWPNTVQRLFLGVQHQHHHIPGRSGLAKDTLGLCHLADGLIYINAYTTIACIAGV